MSKKHSILYSIISISALGIIAKITGLLREGVVAAYFGTTAPMDVFSLSLSYVTTIVTIIAESFAISYFPIFMNNIQVGGEKLAAKRISNVINQYILVSCFVCFVILLFSSKIAEYIHDKVPSVNIDTIRWYVQLLFLTIVTGGLTRIFVCALNGLRKFGWMQITQILYSVIAIVFTVLFSKRIGISILVFAFLINSILQVIILFKVFFKDGRTYSFSINFMSYETVKAWRNLFPVFLGTETYLLGLTIDRTIGISLGQEGVASSFNYAGLLYGLLNTIIAGPIITVFYTELSEKYFELGKDELFNRLRRTFVNIAFLLFPVACFLSAFSSDFIYVILKRGAFDEHSVKMTSSIFCIYALSSIFYAFRGLLSRVFIIMNDMKTPMISGIIFLFLNIFISYILSIHFGIKGVAIGAFLATACSFIYQLLILKYKFIFNFKFHTASLNKIVISTIISAGSCTVLFSFQQFTNKYLRFSLEAIVFIIIYVLFLFIFKSKELENTIAVTKKRFFTTKCNHVH